MPSIEPYFDWEDLTACVPAEMSVGELNSLGAPQRATWPLWLESGQSLADLFLNVRYTSRSFRYGGIADNVLGLNWILPNGQTLGLGGRVVKNVTGFDLVRFLCGSQGRFGRPESLILRLRPLAPEQRVASFQGPWDALERLARSLRASSWSHALDALDLQGGQVHAACSNEASLLPLFEKAAKAWAQEQGLQVSLGSELPLHAARPAARAQVPLSWMLEIASEWPGAVSGFLGQGLLQLDGGSEEALRNLHAQLAAEGGHVEHPSLAPNPQAAQARWETELLKRMAPL